MSQVGRYEILEELGRGGFGRVFRANDPLMKREVAIKVMEGGNDADRLARFRNEAASAGRLHHENIVTIYDFGEDRGMPYIVMEYLRGVDLQKACRRKLPLSMLEKLRILSQVAAGLQNAHEAGIIHRDVKPANIMLLPDKTIKIMDFGIARVTRDDFSPHTRPGLMLGTLTYLPPERFSGYPADALADLWAFGIIAYELIAGLNPVDGAGDAQIIFRITNAKIPSITEYVPDLLPDLVAIVNRLLQRERAARYQSFEDLRIDLNPILETVEDQEVTRLLDQARELAVRGDLSAGYHLVRQTLERRPSNVAARQLRDQMVTELRAREARQQVEGLLKEGDAELATGNFEDAVTRYTQACRILPTDQTPRKRLECATEMLEQARTVQTQLHHVRIWLSEGKLDQARIAMDAVLAANPRNEHAQVLSDLIRQRMGTQYVETAELTNPGTARPVTTSQSTQYAVSSSGLLDRARVIAKALEICRERERLGRVSEAMHVLDVALSRLPDAVELISERRRLESRVSGSAGADTW